MNPQIANPLQQKRDQARKAGYSDEEIDQFLMQMQPPKAAAAPRAQPKKKKNFFLDQISTVGGIIGGIGGSLLSPFAGTAAGAAAGSGLGQALENAITGDSLGKDVAKEAALGGVFGVGPVRGAKAAIGAVRGAGKVAGEQVARTATERGAQNLLGDAWNLKSGIKINGEVLGTQKARNLQKFVIDKVGVPRTASADMVLERLGTYSDETGKAIGSMVRASNRPLTRAENSQLLGAINGRLSKLAGVDVEGSSAAQTLLKQIKQTKSLEDAYNLRRSVDDTINFNRRSATPDPVLERVAKAVRGELDTLTSRNIKGLKPLQTGYSNAKQAIELVGPAAAKPRGINIFNNRIGGGTTQRIKAGLGQFEAPTLTAATAPSRAGIATRVGALGAYRGLSGAPTDENQPLDSTTSTNSIPNPMNISDMSSTYADTSNPASSSGISRESALEAMLIDLQETGGKNLAKIQSLYDFANPKPTAAPKPLNSTAAGTVTDLQNGITNIRQLSEQFKSSGVNNPILGPLRGKNPFDTGAQSLQANIARVKQVIGKALEGGVLRKEDEVKYAKILPTLNDTDSVAQNKINAIADDLERKLMLYQQNIGQGGGGGTLEDLLLGQSAY